MLTHGVPAAWVIGLILSHLSVTQQDAESLKVGVASLINQWVKGPSDGGSRQSPCRGAVSKEFTANTVNTDGGFLLEVK